jgi:hypothetical protein
MNDRKEAFALAGKAIKLLGASDSGQKEELLDNLRIALKADIWPATSSEALRAYQMSTMLNGSWTGSNRPKPHAEMVTAVMACLVSTLPHFKDLLPARIRVANEWLDCIERGILFTMQDPTVFKCHDCLYFHKVRQ